MKETSKKKSYIILTVLSVMIIGLSVAFAALSTTLTINFGNVTQSSQNWNVQFKEESALEAEKNGTSDTGLVCGTVKATTTTATVSDSTLSKPGDKCVWALNVKNTGTIDATLSTITPVTPSSVECTTVGASMVCGNITYKLASNADGSALLATGVDVLNTTGNLPVYLVAEYTGTELSATPVTHTGAGFTMNFAQK